MKRLSAALIILASLISCSESSDPQVVGGGALQEANRVAIEANLREAATAATSYASTNGTGSYDGMDGGKLMNNGFVPDAGITVTVASAAGSSYCLEGTDGTLVLHIATGGMAPTDGPCP